MTDHYVAAQRAAEAHLEACWAAENDEGPEPENTLAPFCGCMTCEVREILHAAYPHLRKAIAEELAGEWQQGGWTVITPKIKNPSGDRSSAVIGTAQVVTDWLRGHGQQ